VPNPRKVQASKSHVLRTGEVRNACKIIVGNPKEKKLLENPTSR